MESALIWSSTAAIMAAIVLPYTIQFKKHRARAAVEKKEAKRLGIEKPLAQHPIIDMSKCIGCATCVTACPEGGVLGIVDGYAQIINGLRCIGHGECEKACPVKGIYMGLGDMSSRDDIPILTEHFETNLDGISIVGELGGLALVRNAMKQGIAVIDTIAKSIRPGEPGDEIVDVCIVGAGPAGLAAALAATEHGLTYTLIDQQGAGGTILQYPKKKMVLTQPIEIPLYGKLKKRTYLKEELLEIWQNIMTRFNIELKEGYVLQSIIRKNGYFELHTNNGTFLGRKIVLALGRRGTPRKLGVPGEDKQKVTYKLVDAQCYQNNHILVVGGGDSAIEAAMGLAAQKGNRVTLCYRKTKFFRIKKRNETKLNSVLKRGLLQVMFDSNITEIQDSQVLLKTPNGVTPLQNDFVFIFAGGIPPFSLLKTIGISFGGSET